MERKAKYFTNMPVTELSKACDEYEALIHDKKLLEEKIENQAEKVLDIMEEEKRGQICLGDIVLIRSITPSKRKLKRQKV